MLACCCTRIWTGIWGTDLPIVSVCEELHWPCLNGVYTECYVLALVHRCIVGVVIGFCYEYQHFVTGTCSAWFCSCRSMFSIGINDSNWCCNICVCCTHFWIYEIYEYTRTTCNIPYSWSTWLVTFHILDWNMFWVEYTIKLVPVHIHTLERIYKCTWKPCISNNVT